MAKASKNKPKKQKGLSDKELIAKYDTGATLDFDSVIEVMYKTPRPISKAKDKK